MLSGFLRIRYWDAMHRFKSCLDVITWNFGNCADTKYCRMLFFRIYFVYQLLYYIFVVPDVNVNWGGTKNRTGIRSGVRSHDQNQSKRIHRLVHGFWLWSPSSRPRHIYQVSQRTWITSPYYRVTTSIHRRFTSIGCLTLFASYGARCNEARRARWIGFDCVRQVRVEARFSPRE